MSETVPSPESSEELRAWIAGLGPYAGPDTLLAFTKAPEGSIDLTHAHPSGLAQLLAGRRTRLSMLIRDTEQYAVAVRTARTLRAKTFELNSDRGIDVGYLAAGIASWTNTQNIQPHHVSAPVLLIAIALAARPDQDDYELQLTEQARVNPALIRHLERAHGITFDPSALARLAYSTARFDPAPVLERLRILLQPIRNARVNHHLLVSTFADLTENLNDPVLLEGNELISALRAVTQDGAGDSAGDRADELDPAEGGRFAPLDSRSPQDELLVLDADAQQQHVIDMVRAGNSLVVSTPPGSGQTQTAINAIAGLVHDGKRVLVVAERRATLNELAQRFTTLGLDSLLLQLSATTGPQQLKAQLVRSIMRNEAAAEPKLDNLHRTLVDYRHQLIDHVASLHNVRQRWGCSPYQAMQSLAQLTSIHPAPSTTVRLKRSVLDSIQDRKELGERLYRAAELGGFSQAATSSAWHGARLVTRKETEEAHALASSLLKRIPAFRVQMDQVSEFAEIRRAGTVAEWGGQLELLMAVRESLDRFTPDIFDRPVADLISATASSGWRREHRVEMASMQRSRLRRVAKEYVRPGVHISDLHASLLLVQEQQAAWAAFATTQRHPAVPTGLAELRGTLNSLVGDLQKLGAALDRTPAGGDLLHTDYDALLARLTALAGDKETLENLPERTLLLESMREHGLGELLDDLAAREVPPSETKAELELAWWQSALEAMISGDDYLAMSDGESLRQLEAEFRLADQAHVASGSARLRWKLAQDWDSGLTARQRQAEYLRNLLKDGRVNLDALTTHSPDLLANLVPIWTVSPLVLPSVLPAGHRFDAVVILDAEATSLQAALPALARGGQVVAFGDEKTAAPRAFSVSVERVAKGEEHTPALLSVFGALSAVLPRRRLTMSYRAVDQDLVLQLSRSFYDGLLERLPDGRNVTGLDRTLVVDYLPDGTGMPGAGADGVESVVAEVNHVVDLVFEHARQRPQLSLAVITASERHAARVAQAIRTQMPNYPDLAGFFASGAESFRVVDIDRAAGMVRDHVIFSLGYGRTPHGRALHNFGPLSAPDGRSKFVLAMTRAREFLQITTCFRPEDLDPERLSAGARDFYELLDRELAGHSLLGSTASRAAASEQLLGEDPLVADLEDRLRARGARVWHHYDGAIDMVAAADPMRQLGRQDEEVPTPVAVESDGTAKYQAWSVRERSRLRPQLLERLGWRYMPLWTIEVFTDPSSCADRIGGYLGLSAELEGDMTSLLGAPLDTGSDMSTGQWSPEEPVALADDSFLNDPLADATGIAAPDDDAATPSPGEHDGADGEGSDSVGVDSDGAGVEGAGVEGAGVEGADVGTANAEEANQEGASRGGADAVADSALANGFKLTDGQERTSPSSGKDKATADERTKTEATDGNEEGQMEQANAQPVLSETAGIEGSDLLPKVAGEDDPRSWGDAGQRDHDEWLKEQRPPHWG